MAMTYTDVYDYKSSNGPSSHWSRDWIYLWGYGSTWSWNHDIKSEGFNPLEENIVEIELALRLSDECYIFGANEDEEEWVDVWADGEFIGSFEVNEPELYILRIENTLMQEDGILNVKLFVPTGDFLFDQSSLFVRTTPIPEPSTAIFICSGLFCLIGLRQLRQRTLIRPR